MLSEDQASHSLIWSDMGKLSSEVMVTTEDEWHQSDCVMNESTVFTGNTKPGLFDTSERATKRQIWRRQNATHITVLYLTHLVIKRILKIGLQHFYSIV